MSFGYVEEKCVAKDKDGIKTFSSEDLLESIDEAIGEVDDDALLNRYKELRKKIESSDDQYEAYQSLYRSDLFDCDIPDGMVYTFSFLWCLYAIRWFCERVKE